MSKTRELLSISGSRQVVNNSADAARSPQSLASPPPPLSLSLSFSLSLSTLLHSQASVYNMCIEQIPQIALSHCCCPVVRVLAPAVAADRIVAYLKGSPFSQAENREIRQDTMPIIVSQFDQGRRTRNREKEREKERERMRAPVTSSDQVCFLLSFLSDKYLNGRIFISKMNNLCKYLTKIVF